MKATLTRKADGWYNLYQDNVGIGSTHSELQGYKLSKQNCDEIFGVLDVDKLFNEVDETIDFHEFCFSSFKLGVNKAMELNKDKQFTLEDVIKAIRFGFDVGFCSNSDNKLKRLGLSEDEFIQSLQQPTEIEVTFNPEEKDSDGCLILKKVEQ